MRDLKRINHYCETHSTQPSALLQELERETHLKTLAPQMLTGHLQGRFLSLISRWVRPLAVLEVGTFTGYGTICLVEGLSDGGIVHTIEVNRELHFISDKYFKKAGLQEKIRQHHGDAKEVIPQLDVNFDLVYLDAGKHDYALHFDLIIDKVKAGGVIIADNVLWSGKVGTNQKDKDTELLESFNQKIYEDKRVENLLLPIRDGLMLIVKRPT